MAVKGREMSHCSVHFTVFTQNNSFFLLAITRMVRSSIQIYKIWDGIKNVGTCLIEYGVQRYYTLTCPEDKQAWNGHGRIEQLVGKGGMAMVTQTFKSVWYLPDENRWRNMRLLAFRDTGKLIVHDDALEFQGKKENLVITHIRHISFGKKGRDFVNDWVKIEYGDGPVPSIAFFADGSWLGWGGFFSGTQRIFAALQQTITKG
jgi:hypothetical protein